jgi:hypothetical protein
MVVNGKSKTLASGAKVWLGDELSPTGGNRVSFTDPEGEVTRVGLSDDAMQALFDLWMSRGAAPECSWQMVPQKIDRTDAGPTATGA